MVYMYTCPENIIQNFIVHISQGFYHCNVSSVTTDIELRVFLSIFNGVT